MHVDPTTCRDIGITECCNDESGSGKCDVHLNDRIKRRCSCNVSCHLRNDCCPDVMEIGCIRKLIQNACSQTHMHTHTHTHTHTYTQCHMKIYNYRYICHYLNLQLEHVLKLEKLLVVARVNQRNIAMLLVVLATVTVNVQFSRIVVMTFQ